MQQGNRLCRKKLKELGNDDLLFIQYRLRHVLPGLDKNDQQGYC